MRKDKQAFEDFLEQRSPNNFKLHASGAEEKICMLSNKYGDIMFGDTDYIEKFREQYVDEFLNFIRGP